MELLTASGDCNSNYLEGGYFDSVLSAHQIPHSEQPIILSLDYDIDGNVLAYQFTVDKPIDYVNNSLPIYIRLVIQSKLIRHSTLMIVVGEDVLWWNPRQYHQTQFSQRLHSQIKTLVREYIKNNGLTHLEDIDHPVPSIHHVLKDQLSGYCTAYVLKYALAHFMGLSPDDGTITGFTREVENNYNTPLTSDIEYDFSPSGATSGLVGGALVGGLIGGGPGLVAGATAGALFGGLFSKHDTIQSKWLPQYSTVMHTKWD